MSDLSGPSSRHPAPRATRAVGSPARPQKDARPSQLDILAEINDRVAAEGAGRRKRLWWLIAASVAGAIALALALGWMRQRSELPVPRATGQRPDPATEALRRSDEPTGTQSAGPGAAAPAVEAVSSAPAPSTAADAASSPPVQAHAGPKSAAPRIRPERRAREADRPEPAAAPAAVARNGPRPEDSPTAAPAPSTLPVEAAATQAAPDVRGVCAGRGNFVSELLCRTRECRRPERRDDPTCVALREIEDSRRGAGQQ